MSIRDEVLMHGNVSSGNSKRFIPELLSPAGSLEKLMTAVKYGADAVYLGGEKFGLRTRADNFSSSELAAGVEFAHSRGSKVYVTINSFLHDSDLIDLANYAKFLDKIKVDAVIVSDLGAISIIRESSDLEVHLSTQTSCLNHYSAKAWKNQGVTRIVTGREVSIFEAAEMKKKAGIEIEQFIHGSMCMSYSGHCTISNFTQGRDSNRGGCAHSCRFLYTLSYDSHDREGLQSKENRERKGFFMSSKDLNGLSEIPLFSKFEIDSLKVEGRMKGALYAATITKVYREALDHYKNGGNFDDQILKEWERELKKVPHRDYAKANLLTKASTETILWDKDSELEDYVIIGEVQKVVKDQFILAEVKNSFLKGDTLEVVAIKGKPKEIYCSSVLNIFDEEIEKTRPSTLVKIPYQTEIQSGDVIRKRVN